MDQIVKAPTITPLPAEYTATRTVPPPPSHPPGFEEEEKRPAPKPKGGKWKSKASKIKSQVAYQNKKDEKTLRKMGGEVWFDPSLDEWPDNDFRVFVGDLGNEVQDDGLKSAFSKYKSVAKVKVVRDTQSGKSKGYGFVSFMDAGDFTQAMLEMQNKYIGNRPVRLKRSKWRDRSVTGKSEVKAAKWHLGPRKAKGPLITK